MRLLSLYIKEYKNLKDFRIEFDPNEPITVLVGRNGSAKSNLIEAIIRVFRDQDAKRPSFEYEATWRAFDHDNKAKSVRVASTNRFAFEVSSPAPSHVVCYYSGTSMRLNDLFRKEEERYHRESLKSSRSLDLRQFILARPIHAQFVLLSFFLRPDAQVDKFFEDTFGITGIDSVLFKLQKPRWAKGGSVADFWGAKGYVQELLFRIRRFSLAPMLLKEREAVSFSQNKTADNYYLYLPHRSSLEGLAGLYDTPQDFFNALETLYLSELISEVRIKVKMGTDGSSLAVRELSEGEQQLLAVLGLMRFTRNSESLYLLDEPDTHLNPAWGLYYMKFLREIGQSDINSHTVIATHDPLLVAGLRKEQLRVLMRSSDGSVKAMQPDEDPRGKGVGAVLTSDLYGLSSQLDLETISLLRQKRNLASKKSLSNAELEELERLNEELEGIDFVDVIPDPHYQALMQALFRKYTDLGLEKPILTPDEIAERKRIADEIVSEMETGT